jgi:hypothetical protein
MILLEVIPSVPRTLLQTRSCESKCIGARAGPRQLSAAPCNDSEAGLTIVDHPARQTAELNSRIKQEFGDVACWRASVDMEMIVVLDFGQRRTLTGKRGPVTIGWFRVLIHGDPWVAELDGKVVLGSEDVLHSGDESRVDPIFVGRQLLRVDWGAECLLTFSDCLVLRISRKNDRPEHDNIVELRFPNGDCVDCFANGTIGTEEGFE